MRHLLVICICTFVFYTAPAQNFKLEDILGAPYVSDLIVSPDRSNVAWVSNERGERKLFMASLPDLIPAQVYSTGSDDGQIISNIQFDTTNEALYFVKGSGPNRRGEIANPASLVEYPERQLLRLTIVDNSLDTLGNHASYVLHSNGREILFPAGSTLFKYDIPSKSKSTILKMRGTISDVSYSPDGGSIIFMSNRGDHSFIGHLKIGEDRIRWISPSIDRDIEPQWSPDGKEIAWIRIPGLKKGELRNLTGGTTFEILTHDLTTNTTLTIWSSPSDDGGFAQYYPSHPLRWTKSGHIVFYSEHEGWMKLYSLNTITGSLNPLMEGACEIEHSTESANGGQIIFSHNCTEIDKRDIAVYDLNSETIVHSVTGPYIESDPIILSDNTLIYRKSSFDMVTGIGLLGSKVNRTIFPEKVKASFPKAFMVEPQQVVFISEDGQKVHGQLFKTGGEEKRPGILFMHGGPIRQMLLGVHYSGYYANAYLMNQYLASQGYVVLSVNFRAGIGYGKNFRRAKNQGPRGASEYQDIVAAAKYLQSLDIVDREKIGLWGGSYGGLLTAQGLAKNSDIFKAGVDFHGVHDWAWRATDFSPGGGWGITEDLMELAYKSSPVADIDGWRSPVLFIHGDDDRNVMFGQTTDLVRRLREKEVYHELMVLPDEVHGFYRWQSWHDAYAATADFFNRFLKNK